MGVSENGVTPKSSIFIGCSWIFHCCSTMISVMVLYCEKILKPKSVSWVLGGGALLWELLSQAQFVHIICVVKKTKPFIHLSLGKAGPLTIHTDPIIPQMSFGCTGTWIESTLMCIEIFTNP